MNAVANKWFLISTVTMNAYSFGANLVERFVNYQSWPKLRSPHSFGSYHRAQQPYIIVFLVIPLILSWALPLPLLFSGQSRLSLFAIWTMTIASGVGFLSTLLCQIPIHRKLDWGYSEYLFRRLMKNDWIRKAADLIRMIATVALLSMHIR